MKKRLTLVDAASPIIHSEFSYKQKLNPISLVEINIGAQERFHFLVHPLRGDGGFNLWVGGCGKSSLDAEPPSIRYELS